jgi:hypothetical protein
MVLQPLSKGQMEKAHRLLMIFLVVSAIPFRALDSPHFAAFLQQLRPSYQLPGNERLTAICKTLW